MASSETIQRCADVNREELFCT